MRSLIINDEEVEGVADIPVSYSKKAADIGQLQERLMNHTNVFKAPFTERNHRTLQDSYNPLSTTSFPYVLHDVKMIEDGIEIISGGKVTVRRCEGYYELYVLSGPAGFYKAIAGKKLTDLDLSALNAGWDPDNMMDETTGIVFPVLDWGQFDGSSMDTWANLFSIYYHTIVNQIFTDAGYNKAGAVFSNNKYLRMIVPYGRPKFEYDPSFVIPYEFSAIKTANQVNVNPGLGTVVHFTTEVKESDYYDPNTGKYINTSSVPIYAHFYAQFSYTFSGGIGFTVEIRKNGASVLATGGGTPAGGTITLDSRTLHPDGVPVQTTEEVYVMFTSTTGTVTILLGGKFYNQVLQIPIASAPLGDTAFGKLLPDMTQTDFIRDFMVRFGLIPSERNGTITFKSINEIINDVPGAKDWTYKRTAKQEALSFNPLSYAQNNYFRDSESEDVNPDLGKGNMEVSNENAETEKDIYTSPFANTSTELVLTMLTARIPVFSTSDPARPFENEPGMRLLLVRDKYSFEPTINGNTSYKVAYYDDPNQDYSMSWEDALADNYSSLEIALQKAKVVRREYTLTLNDFLDIDFMYIVFDRDAYWMINEVPNFVNKKPVTVELFKLT